MGLETVVCWRGCGGVARGRRLRAALLLFPTVAKNSSSSLLLRFFPFLVAVCSRFGFGFFGFGFLLLGLFLLFSLSSGRSLSLSLFGSLGFFFSPLSLRVLSIYRKRNGAGMTFASAPSITQRLVGH